MESITTPKITPNDSLRQDDNYKDKYERIHSTIEDLNARLMQMFHKKEVQLLEEYKREMFRAQNELNELRDNTNEEELKRKMIEKKEQLQKERETFLQASIQFSNRCEVFKHKLQHVVSETRDIESEIKFLNEQIDSANRKNLSLKEELQGLNTIDSQNSITKEPNDVHQNSASKMSLPSTNVKTIIKRRLNDLQNSSNLPKRYQQEDSARRQSKVESSMKRNLSYNNVPQQSISKTEIKRTRDKAQRIREMLNDPIFQETDFERMFVESVKAVKDRKISKKESMNESNPKRLPSLKKSPTHPTIEDEPQLNSTSNGVAKMIREFQLSDGQLSEFDKRAIMEDFLSREQVKQYLYRLIFKEALESGRSKIAPPS